MEQYPAIRFLLRFGEVFALVVALLPVSAGIIAAFYGWHWMVLVAGVAGSLVLAVLLKSYVELVRVIADMLMPR